MAGAHEVPPAAQVSPGQVRAEPAVPAVAEVELHGLAGDVVDPVGELEDEGHRVEVLPDEVRRVPVEAERLAVADRLEGAPRGPVVVRDLGRVHLVREADAHLVEDVEDRVPAVGEILVAGIDHRRGRGREHRHVLPDRRAGEPDHGLHPEPRGGTRGVLHLLGRALAHALGVSVAPDGIRQDAAVALVDRVVADRLPLEVVGDGEDLEVVALEQRQLLGDVVVVDCCAVGVEVVAPAGDLEAVVAPRRGEARDLLERQVGPLAGEERDGTAHDVTSSWDARRWRARRISACCRRSWSEARPTA